MFKVYSAMIMTKLGIRKTESN